MWLKQPTRWRRPSSGISPHGAGSRRECLPPINAKKSRDNRDRGMKPVLLLVAAILSLLPATAAEFRSGQAARAVIGQASFSGREGSFTPTVLSISGGNLYVSDNN